MKDGHLGPRDLETEVISNYNVWRTVANMAGSGGPYDEPDWQDGRLYFRSDYSEKVKKWPEWAESGYWGAWIISPAQDEYFVLFIRYYTREQHSAPKTFKRCSRVLEMPENTSSCRLAIPSGIGWA